MKQITHPRALVCVCVHCSFDVFIIVSNHCLSSVLQCLQRLFRATPHTATPRFHICKDKTLAYPDVNWLVKDHLVCLLTLLFPSLSYSAKI